MAFHGKMYAKLSGLHEMLIARFFFVSSFFGIIALPVEFVEYSAFQNLFIYIRIIRFIEQTVEQFYSSIVLRNGIYGFMDGGYMLVCMGNDIIDEKIINKRAVCIPICKKDVKTIVMQQEALPCALAESCPFS